MNARSSADAGWSNDQYQLIDFGEGRKLERFGALILDRPCPAAQHARPAQAQAWQAAHLQLTEHEALADLASRQRQLVDPWRVRYQQVVFDLRITPFGHVGLFPEHAAQWQWLLAHAPTCVDQGPRLLNLFAYTGGATLAMASHGWHVTHVDASVPTVSWARHNAELSQLQTAPVRWLVEDARAYVARELKRQRRYEAILLDPPSYGHGPTGKAWHIERDLPRLIEQCCQLLTVGGTLTLTGHSDTLPIDDHWLKDRLVELGHAHCTTESTRVTLVDAANRALDFGWCLKAYTEIDR